MHGNAQLSSVHYRNSSSSSSSSIISIFLTVQLKGYNPPEMFRVH